MNLFKAIRDYIGSDERKQIKAQIADIDAKLNMLIELQGQKDSPEKDIAQEESEKTSSPFKTMIVSNGNVTIILNDGTTLSKSEVSEDEVNKIQNSVSIDEVKKIMTTQTPDASELEEMEDASTIFEEEDYDTLKKFDKDFNVNNLKEVKLAGIQTPLPPTIIAAFIEIIEKLRVARNIEENEEEVAYLEDYLNRFKLYTAKLLTGVRKESQAQILTYCKENDVRISSLGNIIAYRAMNKWGMKAKDIEYEDIEVPNPAKVFNPHTDGIIKMYNLAKSRKKGIDIFDVYYNSELGYTITPAGQDKQPKHPVTKKPYDQQFEKLGNLKALFLALPNDSTPDTIIIQKEVIKEEKQERQQYTSNRNPGRYIVSIGDVYKEDESKINLDAGICAAGGLHAANVAYDYDGNGDTRIVVLINPGKTITVPLHDGGKFRTVEMKLACLNPNQIGEHIDEELVKKADEEYHQYTIYQLENALQTKALNGLAIQGHMPTASISDLESINKMLKTRVIEIV